MTIKDYDAARVTMVRVAYLADDKAAEAAECALAVMVYASKATRVAPQKRYALWFEAQAAVECLYLNTMMSPVNIHRPIVRVRGEGMLLTPPPK